MRSYIKPLYYLFHRNKYFLIGSILGIILTSIFNSPLPNNCHDNQSNNGLHSGMITSLKINPDEYDLFINLKEWFEKMASPIYNPVIRKRKKILEENNDKSMNELNPDTNHKLENVMVHDKKLKFYRPRFHSIELNVKMKLIICILIRQQFFIDSFNNPTGNSLHFYQKLIHQYMNMTNEFLFNNFKDDIIYFHPKINNNKLTSDNIVITYNAGKNVEIRNNVNGQPYHVQIIDYLMEKKKFNEYGFVLMITDQTIANVFNLENYLQLFTVSDLVLSTSDGTSIEPDDNFKLNYFLTNLGQNDTILNYGLLISSTLIFMCYNDNWSCYVRNTILNNRNNSTGGNIHYWHLSFQMVPDINLTSLDQSLLDKYKKEISKSIFIYPIKINTETFNLIQTLIIVDNIEKLKSDLEITELSIETNSGTNIIEGLFSYLKPRNRYEVIRWIYFNETHVFMPNDIQTIRLISDEELNEIKLVKWQCFEWIQVNQDKFKLANKIEMKQLIIENFYKKFYAFFGLEYIVDLKLPTIPKSYRFKILKPLNPVELLTDVPHVTENLRLTMILPVRGYLEVPLAIKFLNHYGDVCLKNANHQTILIIAMIQTRYLHLNDSIIFYQNFEKKEFERLKKISLYLKTKYEDNSAKIVFMDMNVTNTINSDQHQPKRTNFPSELVYLDLISRSLSLTSNEPLLILHCRSNMLFTNEFLNRVRINTIVNKQIFISIPFVEYRLRTSMTNNNFKQLLTKLRNTTDENQFQWPISKLSNTNVKIDTMFDVRKDNGYFDDGNNELIAFYLQDYIRARKQTETLMPIVRNRQSLIKYPNKYYNVQIDLFHMFQSFNRKQIKRQNALILMRAIEPDLKLFHSSILDDCDYFESNQYGYKACQDRKIQGLGPKQKLAAIVYEHMENKIKK